MAKGEMVYVSEVGYGFVEAFNKGLILVSLDKLKGAVRWFLESEVVFSGKEIKVY